MPAVKILSCSYHKGVSDPARTQLLANLPRKGRLSLFAHDAFILNSEGDLFLGKCVDLFHLVATVGQGRQCCLLERAWNSSSPSPSHTHTHPPSASQSIGEGHPRKVHTNCTGSGLLTAAQVVPDYLWDMHSLQAGNIAHSSTQHGDSSRNPELQQVSLDASGLAHTSQPHAC